MLVRMMAVLLVTLATRLLSSSEAVTLPTKTTPTLIMLQPRRARIPPIFLVPARAQRVMPIIIRRVPCLSPLILAPAERPAGMSPVIRLSRVQQSILILLLVSTVLGAAVVRIVGVAPGGLDFC